MAAKMSATEGDVTQELCYIGVLSSVVAFATVGHHLLSSAQKVHFNPALEKKVREYALSSTEGSLRATLEIAVDSFSTTRDSFIRKILSGHVEKLHERTDLLFAALDEAIRIESASPTASAWAKVALGRDAALKRAVQKAIALLKDEEVEKSFKEFVQGCDHSNEIRSEFELHGQGFVTTKVSKPLGYISSLRIIEAELENSHLGQRTTVTCVVEDKERPWGRDPEEHKRGMEIAKILQHTNKSKHIMEFAGFAIVPTSVDLKQLQLVFILPEDCTDVMSLRHRLLPSSSNKYRLPRKYRYTLSQQLTEAVYQVHKLSLVHKCIRPENILLARSDRESNSDSDSEDHNNDRPDFIFQKSIGTVYLTGWQHARKGLPELKWQTPADWIAAFYQHPSRQTGSDVATETRYTLAHDIYSFGLCLLELGLWDSFIYYHGPRDREPTLAMWLRDEIEAWKEANPEWTRWKWCTDAWMHHFVFVEIAGGKLRQEMGDVYASLVISCLSCVEMGFAGIDDFVNSRDGRWTEQGEVFVKYVGERLAGEQGALQDGNGKGVKEWGVKVEDEGVAVVKCESKRAGKGKGKATRRGENHSGRSDPSERDAQDPGALAERLANLAKKE